MMWGVRPSVGASHATHWWSEVWSVEENQWHAVDSSDYERTYGSFWMLRVPKSTILSTTSERGGWNAISEQRWEAFTNTIALFYPSGRVVARVLDHLGIRHALGVRWGEDDTAGPEA